MRQCTKWTAKQYGCTGVHHAGVRTAGTGNRAGDSSHQGQGTIHTRDREQFTPGDSSHQGQGTVHTRDSSGIGSRAGDSSHQGQGTVHTRDSSGTGSRAGDSSHQGTGQGTVHTRDSSGTGNSSHQGTVLTRDREQGSGQFTPGTGSRAGDSSHQHSNSLCTDIYLQFHHFSTAALTPHCYSKHQPLLNTSVLTTSPYWTLLF